MSDNDLPTGYRWADEEDLVALPEGWVEVGSRVAVPALIHTCEKCGKTFDEDLDGGAVIRWTSDDGTETKVLKAFCFEDAMAYLEGAS